MTISHDVATLLQTHGGDDGNGWRKKIEKQNTPRCDGQKYR